MSRLLLESPQDAADVPERQNASRPTCGWTPPGQSLDLTTAFELRAPDPRTALSCAGLAAAVIGLLGVDAGLVWLVAGVWTLRAMAGAPLGAAWGVACLGAGLRWGSTSLGDIAVATRLSGGTVLTGSLGVRIGMVAALAGAVVGEAQADGFRADSWGERAAAGVCVVALVPAFLVRGAGDPHSLLPLLWGSLSAAGVFAVLVLGSVMRRLPAAFPTLLAAGGVFLAATVR